MATTPGKPRTSGIPARSAIPTPGRARAASGSAPSAPVMPQMPDMNTFEAAMRAHDPATHRTTPHSMYSTLSPESVARSGRRSVASNASSSSATPAPIAAPRYSTPTVSTQRRSQSRQSDVFARSSSRAGAGGAGGAFEPEVGDGVRLESHGFEGVLRFVGEIDGKPGLWAGVELSGGFAGKGKNDGSVNGVYYFRCPPACGVFAKYDKLSPPTVGPGAYSRPSSVASSRGGRQTPSFSLSQSTSGRVTPSSSAGFSSGRVTPASRIGQRTPSARTRTKTAPDNSLSTSSIGTPGFGLNSKTPRPGMSSKPGVGLGLPSTTPTKPRQSLTGLNANGKRIPSAIAMPPPASPASASRAYTPLSAYDPSEDVTVVRRLDSGGARDEIAENNRAIQDRIAALTNGQIIPARSSSRASTAADDSDILMSSQTQSSFPSATSQSFSVSGQNHNQAEMDALVADNARLRGLLSSARGEEEEHARRADELRFDRDAAAERARAMERELAELRERVEEERAGRDALVPREDAERALKEADEAKQQAEAVRVQLQALQKDADDARLAAEEARAAAEEQSARAAEFDTRAAELAEREREAAVRAQGLEDMKNELESEVDALRAAGQETIALYEERLSEAEQRRYELEDALASARRLSLAASEPASPGTRARAAASAAEIERDELKEHVAHLQKKLAGSEDVIEELRAGVERDEGAYRERVGRWREKEEGWRREREEAGRELERVRREADAARARVEEVEEAFREGTVALENARAEIEGLRAELADLESARGHAHNGAEGEGEVDGLREKVKALTVELEGVRKKANRDVPVEGASGHGHRDSRSDGKELAGLKHIVSEQQKELAGLAQANKVLESENRLLLSETEQLREEMRALEDSVERSIAREEAALASPAPGDDSALAQQVKDMRVRHEAELDALRKRQSEAEMKSARTIHDLNKEIGELEALVESKIYREDELEQEVERLRAKAARKSSRSGAPPPPPAEDARRGSIALVSTTNPRASISSSIAGSSVNGHGDVGPGVEVCEICEQPGHDIFTCEALKGSGAPVGPPPSGGADVPDVFCEDCEGYGHTAAECPPSLDVF
ncbi:hypothetical protein PENSPDRAFT_221273 [Peniophora sp. CONT]|nr:hypothetical protein PENSPDRAFT_221273 [Peniophora sp. CONT]